MPAKGCYLLCFLLEKCVVWNTALREGWRQKVETLVGRNPSFNKADLSVLPSSSNVNQHQNICSAQRLQNLSSSYNIQIYHILLCFLLKNYKTNRAKNQMHNFVLFSKQKLNEFGAECVGRVLSELEMPADSTPTMRDWSTDCSTRFPDYHPAEHGVSAAHTKTGRSQQCERSPNPIPP